ncbi:hypothetical protein TGAM01_v210936 [Trichoderma gamsii]|uniref:Uncharacterized protein n=1 Tax=Trichoderma gamsii TaxID=398673 RepID=A0A2P4Z7D1_9HYPO|nr:hypothetical protein TGAM01_v210936 [Trichoderma gamsii]PON20180.1 hypothetical protein TGAM01_v210936 [Trichoderma gamsii]
MGLRQRLKKKIQKAKQLVSEENRYHIINSTPLRKNHIARSRSTPVILRLCEAVTVHCRHWVYENNGCCDQLILTTSCCFRSRR